MGKGRDPVLDNGSLLSCEKVANMEKGGLAINYNAVNEPSKQNVYLLMANLRASQFFIPLILIRSLTKAPILVMKQHHDGAKKNRAIEMVAGADKCIQWPNKDKFSPSYIEHSVVLLLPSLLSNGLSKIF